MLLLLFRMIWSDIVSSTARETDMTVHAKCLMGNCMRFNYSDAYWMGVLLMHG